MNAPSTFHLKANLDVNYCHLSYLRLTWELYCSFTRELNHLCGSVLGDD